MGGAAGLLLAAATTGDLTFPVNAQFTANINNGFAASPPQEVHALHGDYAAGAFGALNWCDPWPGTHIQSATIGAYRFHTTTTTTIEQRACGSKNNPAW